MKPSTAYWIAVLAISGVLSDPLVQAADSPKPAAAATPAKPPTPPPVIYRPAAGSAPAARLTGGSRGSGSASVRLDVLAPDQTGLTTEEQPSLFWFQSNPAPTRFELTLLDEKKIKPVLQVNISQATNAGVHRLRLADHGIKLTPGVEYQWVIALVLDPNNRSRDLVASGFIKRVEPAGDLKAKLSGATADALPGIYAEAGIWHDALAKLSDLIDAEPANESLRQRRAELLRQIGLKEAASASITGSVSGSPK